MWTSNTNNHSSPQALPRDNRPFDEAWRFLTTDDDPSTSARPRALHMPVISDPLRRQRRASCATHSTWPRAPTDARTTALITDDFRPSSKSSSRRSCRSSTAPSSAHRTVPSTAAAICAALSSHVPLAMPLHRADQAPPVRRRCLRGSLQCIQQRRARADPGLPLGRQTHRRQQRCHRRRERHWTFRRGHMQPARIPLRRDSTALHGPHAQILRPQGPCAPRARRGGIHRQGPHRGIRRHRRRHIRRDGVHLQVHRLRRRHTRAASHFSGQLLCGRRRHPPQYHPNVIIEDRGDDYPDMGKRLRRPQRSLRHHDHRRNRSHTLHEQDRYYTVEVSNLRSASTPEEESRIKEKLASSLLRDFFGVDSNMMDFADRSCRVDFNTRISHPMAQVLHGAAAPAPPLPRLYLRRDILRHEALAVPPRLLRRPLRLPLRGAQVALRPRRVGDIVKSTMEKLMKQISVVLYAHQCDIVILSPDAPQALDAVTELFVKYLPVTPDRLVRLNNYHVGQWYPQADPQGLLHRRSRLLPWVQ